MMIVNPSMKEKYPMWYEAMEKQEQQQRIDNMILEAEYNFSKYEETKMNDIDNIVSEIIRKLKQTDYNIETMLNEQPLTNTNINKEIKKMVIEQFKNALR